MSPATTATHVSVRWPPGRRLRALRVRTTGLSSARICRHAMVRRMNEVKNGATTQISMTLRQRPALNAMV